MVTFSLSLIRSELNLELEKMTQDDCTDLESLFGRICALDKCLGRVRQAQTAVYGFSYTFIKTNL